MARPTALAKSSLPASHSSTYRRASAASATRFFPLVSVWPPASFSRNRKTVRGRSEEHTSELQSLMRISYAVFCLKKKNNKKLKKHAKATQTQHNNTNDA